MATDYRHDLAEMELTELEQALESMGHPRFHGRQLFQWVHKRGVTDFARMTDLGRELRGASPTRSASSRPTSSGARRRATARRSSCCGSKTAS